MFISSLHQCPVRVFQGPQVSGSAGCVASTYPQYAISCMSPACFSSIPIVLLAVNTTYLSRADHCR